MTTTVSAYAATSATDPLTKTTIERRGRQSRSGARIGALPLEKVARSFVLLKIFKRASGDRSANEVPAPKALPASRCLDHLGKLPPFDGQHYEDARVAFGIVDPEEPTILPTLEPIAGLIATRPGGNGSPACCEKA